MTPPQQIKETVRKDRGLSMGKIRIHIHLPPIIDALHNAALKARRELLEKAKKEGKNRKLHCNVTLSPPWVQLVEMTESGVKVPIPFVVEDGRLADPANTLATLSLRERGRENFKPFKFLSEEEKKMILEFLPFSFFSSLAFYYRKDSGHLPFILLAPF